MTNDKVYVVRSHFYLDEPWHRVEGIFTDPFKAEEVKAKVIAKMEALKDIPEPNNIDMTNEEYDIWNSWFDNNQIATDFYECEVTEYTLNQEISL